MNTKWTKFILLCALAWVPLTAVLADFSDARLSLHPTRPGALPFIIEITGTWPSDCHPGEQRPFVSSFDGQTVEIEFEIVVIHVTCNDVDTPYRVLVDMSEAIRKTPATGDSLDVRVEFEGAVLQQSVALACPPGQVCPAAGSGSLPERGLYTTPQRRDEGLLVARQNQVTVIYPLVYDQSGHGEWLLSVSPVVEGSFFSELFRSSGGDCFDCEPGNPDTELLSAGHISVLVDQPGSLQVKVNDRPFLPYTKMVYGYQGTTGGPLLADLGGRWALSENEGTDPPLGDITNFLPAAFDISVQSVLPGDPDQVIYLVRSVTGQELGQLVCGGVDSFGAALDFCEFIDETDPADPLFRFYQDGPSSLFIVYGRAVIAIGTPPSGKAVRLD